MNIILGSGIIGLLAKKILGDDWTLIPFKKSRYFYFDIPWADNYIKFDNEINDFMKSIIIDDSPMIMYKSPFSYQGQLFDVREPVVIEKYLTKLYGDKIPDVADQLLTTSFMIYPVTVKHIYEALQRKYIGEIRENTSLYGSVKSINITGQEILFNNDQKLEYDKIISTIPLNALCDYCSLSIDLEARPIYYYHIATDVVDLEGAQQSLVCDFDIPFFKVVKLNENIYNFWCLEAIEEPYKVFGSILGYNFEILEVRYIDDVIPLGEPPNLGIFEKNLICVGSNAQWDDFMDVSSCIKRLIRLRSSVQ